MHASVVDAVIAFLKCHDNDPYYHTFIMQIVLQVSKLSWGSPE